MKLYGGSRKSRHNSGAVSPRENSQSNSSKPRKKKASGKVIALRIIIIVLAVVLALLIAFYAWYKSSVRMPENDGTLRPGANTTIDPNTGEEVPVSPPTKAGNSYTFALMATDDGNGNTDVMMVIQFDTTDYSFNVVSIPRDTLVNVSWNVKKANTFYSIGGTDRVVEGLADLLGFYVDFYVMVDLEAVEVLIDSIGGVWYDVPHDMKYSDPDQNLSINISKGYKLLNGKDSLGVLRYRATYATGDIKRIEVQQDFLMEAVKQILENSSSINLTNLAKIFLNYVKTDLTLGNVLALGQEFFKVDIENVHFMTMPGNISDSVKGVSYVTIYVDQWLDMVNEYLNPFVDRDITANDVSILTRNSSGAFYVTDGNWQAKQGWGGSSSGTTSNGNSSTGSNTATPPPANTTSPSPSIDVSPSPDNTDPIIDNPDTSANPDDPLPPPTEPTTPDDPITAPSTPPDASIGPDEPQSETGTSTGTSINEGNDTDLDAA